MSRLTPRPGGLRIALVALMGLLLTAGSASASSYAITLDGTPLTVQTTASGEKANITFAGIAGHRVSVRTYNVMTTQAKVNIVKPDGTNLTSPVTYGYPGGFINPVTLPVTGNYKIVVAPVSPNKGKVTVQAWDVPADTTVGPVTTDGTSNQLTFDAPGQNGTVTFAGTAGQRISLLAGGGTAKSVNISLKDPSNAVLWGPSSTGQTTTFMDTLTLPSTGTYTVFANPGSYTTGTTNVQVWDVGTDQSGTFTLPTGATPLTFNTPGQNLDYTFAGTAAQKVTLAVTPVSLSAGGSATVSIKKPDNTKSTITVTNSGGLIEPLTLPTTGTYHVLIDPVNQTTGSITVNLYTSPADNTGLLPAGTPTTGTFVIGQNAAYTFSGTTGQRFALNLTNDSISTANVSVLTPSGTTLIASTAVTTAGKYFDPVVLPATGTYTIKINPQGIAAGSVDITPYIVPADVTVPVTYGNAGTVTTTTPSQNGKFTFSGTAGQKVSLVFSNVTEGASAISGVTSSLKQGSTTVVSNFSYGTNGKYIDTFTLPTTGTYTVAVDPAALNTGSVTMTAYNVSADASTAATIGTLATVSNTMPGQNMNFTFTGAAGQTVSVYFSSITAGSGPTSGITGQLVKGATVIKPNFGFGNNDYYIDTFTLPTAGTYTMKLDPALAQVGSVSMMVYNVGASVPVSASMNGSPNTITIPTPGQTATVSFAGTAGKSLATYFSIDTIGNLLSSATVTLKNPSGTTIATYDISSGPTWREPIVLAATGTYTMVVDPKSYYTGTASLTLYDVPASANGGTLTVGGAALTATTTPGQTATFSFTTTSATTVTIQYDPGFTNCPPAAMLVQKAGVTQASWNVLSADINQFTTAAGTNTYTIVVDPTLWNAGNLTVQLS